MWPFKKKDAFDLDSLEKELSAGSSSSLSPSSSGSSSLNMQPDTSHHDFDSEEDDGGFAKTTKQDRHDMARSFSNTDDSFISPSNHAPVTGNSSSPDFNTSFVQSSYNSNLDSNNFGSQSNFGSSSNVSSDKIAHKMEVMERQIEILSSKVDLLKVNIETINSKISNIDQKIDKKLNNSWM